LFDDLVADASAPLLNRATQGQYQPGLTLQPFVLASALDQGIISLRDHVEGGDDPVVVHDQLRGCSDVLQEPATWSAVLKAACPAPMVDLAAELGEEGLLLSFERFGFFAQPEFPVATIAVESQPIADIQSAIVGQGSLTVTPLQVARGWAALANGGALPDPYLVTEIQNSAGVWQAEKLPEPNLLAVSQGSADAIVAALRDEETGIVEHSTAALSGPQAATNEWYLGLTPAQTPQFAVVLVIENPSSASAAERVGRSVLELAQEAD
jgi:peptidoglycan glycosyltransferase